MASQNGGWWTRCRDGTGARAERGRAVGRPSQWRWESVVRELVAWSDAVCGREWGMVERIVFSGLELRFRYGKDETGGSLDLFEMTLQPKAALPIAHHHASWDETVYGLAGVTTWQVDGREVMLRPGETLFIRRGVVHAFRNDGPEPATLAVHPDPRCARPRLLPRTGGPGRRRCPRPGQSEGDHAAAQARAGGAGLGRRLGA